MTGRQTPRSPWPIAVALIVTLAAPITAAPAKVTVQADRKDAQVGQPVLVTVRVRGAEEAPTIKPPTVEGARLVPMGEPAVVPTLAADLESKGVFGPGGGSHLVNALRGVGKMPDLGALNPDFSKMIGDPNLLKGQQQAAQGIAGLNTNDYVFTYQLTPERAGQLSLAGFTVSSKGQTTTTPPLGINVTEAKSQPWVRLALSLSNPTPLVGEEVQLHVDLLIQRGQVSYAGKAYPYLPVSKMALNLPPLDGARQFELAKPLEQVVRENAIEPGKHGFRVNNLPGEVKLEHEPADAKAADLDPARYRRRLSIPLRVREGGEATIAAAHAAGEVYVPHAGNKGQWEQFVVASEPLTFTILDLRRRADRPPDFTGAVGSLRVTAQASQTRMPAGTPFTLTLRLEGNGSVASAGAPDLASRPEFTKSFRVRAEEARNGGSNLREFTYTLRPLSEAVTEVPAISVSYLDPKTNRFGKAQSQLIPLEVTAAQNATPDAPPAPAAAAPAAAPAPPPAEEDEPATSSLTDSLLPWAEGAMAVGLAACAAVWAVRRFRRGHTSPAHPAPAVPAVLATPRPPAVPAPLPVARVRRDPPAPAPTFAGVRQTLQDFLRRRFHLSPGEVTPHDAAECLRRGGVPEGLARSFGALLETCDTAEFAPGVVSTSPSDLAAYARQLMNQIMAAIPAVVV
jgi:hypothetical protein